MAKFKKYIHLEWPSPIFFILTLKIIVASFFVEEFLSYSRCQKMENEANSHPDGTFSLGMELEKKQISVQRNISKYRLFIIYIIIEK